MDFDTIHAHVAALPSLPAPPATREAALASLCPIWKAASPIIQLVLLLPFIPAAWKVPVQTFVSWMNVICP